MLQRRHYEVLADTIRTLNCVDNPKQRAAITDEFCDALRRDNPRFDAEKFRQRVGILNRKGT